MVIKTLLDLVRELNALNDDNLAERVIKDGDVQWCLLELQDILEAGQSALRPVSREQAEKIRGEWVQNRNAIIDSIMCSKCGAIYQAYYGGYPYCPRCGAPMTDEAADMVMERLEGMKDGTD